MAERGPLIGPTARGPQTVTPSVVRSAQSVVAPLVAPESEGSEPERRRELQERRLRRLVDVLLAAGGTQAGRLRERGVLTGADVGLHDLHRLPFVTKQDVLDAYPFGFRACPERDVACVHGTAGTKGQLTLAPYTAHDLDVWAQVMARALGGAGVAGESFVHSAFGYGLFTGGFGVHHGATRLGATVLPISSGTTDRQLRMILDLRPDVLCCTPSYAIYLGEAFRSTGITPDQLSLQVGLFGAEPWTEEMRAEIEQLLGLRALDIYGITEVVGLGVACESLGSEGRLNIAEDHFYPEVIGPDDEPVPDGAPGDLTLTTLTKTGMPLLRYRTGDVAALDDPAPDSARTLRRMTRVLGRRDDMLVIQGATVFPTEIEAVLLADRRVSPHYMVVEDRRDASDPQLRVAVEPHDPHGDAARLEEDLAFALRERLGIACHVRVLEPDLISRARRGNQLRLVRWEHGLPPLPGLE